MPVSQLAFARSGDKGRHSNVAVVAFDEAAYDLLREHLTAERVAAHFERLADGPVVRYEVPNLRALNFVVHNSLGGGASQSMRTDSQGKTHALGLLQLWIDVPDGAGW